MQTPARLSARSVGTELPLLIRLSVRGLIRLSGRFRMHGQSLHLGTSCLVAVAACCRFVDEMTRDRRIGAAIRAFSRTQLPSVGSLNANQLSTAPPPLMGIVRRSSVVTRSAHNAEVGARICAGDMSAAYPPVRHLRVQKGDKRKAEECGRVGKGHDKGR